MTKDLIDMTSNNSSSGVKSKFICIERDYCLICRKEIMTESGQVCEECARRSPPFDSHKFRHVYINNPIVNAVIRSGGSMLDCIVALAAQNIKLLEEVMKLDLIAPKKIKIEDGTYRVWRCPDELIPCTELKKE